MVKSQKKVATRLIVTNEQVLDRTDIWRSSPYLFRLYSEAKKRSKMMRNAKLALRVACPDGYPRFNEQPLAGKSDQTQVGRGSFRIILMFNLTKVAS